MAYKASTGTLAPHIEFNSNSSVLRSSRSEVQHRYGQLDHIARDAILTSALGIGPMAPLVHHARQWTNWVDDGRVRAEPAPSIEEALMALAAIAKRRRLRGESVERHPTFLHRTQKLALLPDGRRRHAAVLTHRNR